MDGWGWQVWTSFFIVGATQDCGFGASCLFIYFLLDTTMMAFHGLPPLEFPALFPDKCNEVFFARPMHSTSQFDKTVLSKCVIVCVCVQTSSFWLVGRISLTVMMVMWQPCRWARSLWRRMSRTPGFDVQSESSCIALPHLPSKWDYVITIIQFNMQEVQQRSTNKCWDLLRFAETRCASDPMCIPAGDRHHDWQRPCHGGGASRKPTGNDSGPRGVSGSWSCNRPPRLGKGRLPWASMSHGPWSIFPTRSKRKGS